MVAKPNSMQQIRKRLLLLFIMLLSSIALYVVLSLVAPPSDGPPIPFVPVWLLCFLPYLAACAFILKTRPLEGRWRWVELGIILGGALIYRLMLLPLPPGLSRDVWRYLWDARVIVHGYSPYVYAPADKVLLPLRNILFVNSRFRNEPTKYPPGAEGFFVLGYLLSPQSLLAIKGLFVMCDMVTCSALAWLLARRGLDPRRTIIYAWCPLPIVEFAAEGHLDALVVMFSVLAILCASSTKPGMRALTGFLIAMGTLAKFYPIILLVAVARRRDWALFATCFITIFLGYLPFLILGHGDALGVLLSFATLPGFNAGILYLMLNWISVALGLGGALPLIVGLLLVGVVSLIVLLLRRHERITVETATLLLIGTVFATYSHVFPWYAIGLLPWVVPLVGPVRVDNRFGGKGLAVAIIWYCTCTFVLYYILSTSVATLFVWYAIAYGVAILGLVVAARTGFRAFLRVVRAELVAVTSRK